MDFNEAIKAHSAWKLKVIHPRQSRGFVGEPLKAVDASRYWNRLCC